MVLAIASMTYVAVVLLCDCVKTADANSDHRRGNKFTMCNRKEGAVRSSNGIVESSV